MKVIIPVAGSGTRLRPHTYSAPKVLLNVAGQPILGHIVSKFVQNGITDIIVVTGYLGDMVKEYLGNSFSNVHFSYVEQEELLGLGHAIWLTRSFFDSNEHIFIALGDTIFEADLNSVFKNPASMLGVRIVDDPKRFGIVDLKQNQVKHLTEKPNEPTSNLALVGLYSIKNSSLLFSCLDSKITGNVKTKGEFQLTDALQSMIEKGEVFLTFPVQEWYDCGKPETMLSTNRELLSRTSINNPQFENVLINDPVFIDPTAMVQNSIIGPYATISKGSFVQDSIISDSIISENARITNIMLTQSIIGKHAKIKGRSRKINIGDFSEVDFDNSNNHT